MSVRAQAISRRDLLRAGAGFAGAAAFGALAAACGGGGDGGSEPFGGTLRVLGLRTDLADPVKAAAERDLPFRLNFDVTTPQALIERVLERPGSFDVLSGGSHDVDRLLAAGTIAGLDRSRILGWPDVGRPYRLGTVSAGGQRCVVGEGRTPSDVLYATAAGPGAALAAYGEESGNGSGEDVAEPAAVVGAPSTFSMESFGYDASALSLEPEEVSWAELLNERWSGRVAVVDDPVAGLQETGLAARALGLTRIQSLGDPTRAEIDGLVGALLSLRRKGHFRAFLSSFDESVDLMAAGDVLVGSLTPPAAMLLRTAGHPVRSAAPPEGYRAWAGLLFASSAASASPLRLQAVHDYIDWWHSGVPGAILMRHGYYNAAMAASRPIVSRAEWDYWIEGKPAVGSLAGAFGPGSIPPDSVRDGGPMRRRICRVAVWHSPFAAHEHATARWAELVAA